MICRAASTGETEETVIPEAEGILETETEGIPETDTEVIVFPETETQEVHLIEFGSGEYTPGPDGTLRGVSYSIGGGMENRSEFIYADLLEDGSVLLEFGIRDSSDVESRCYLADEEFLHRIDQTAAEYGLRREVERPEPEFEALDAASTTLTLFYENEDTAAFYSISSLEEWTAEEEKGVQLIVEMLSEKDTKEGMLPEEQAEKLKESLYG